jgi:hypothetical protein
MLIPSAYADGTDRIVDDLLQGAAAINNVVSHIEPEPPPS